MPALSNPRHEKYAQGLAEGLTQTEAYTKAGYKFHKGNASLMASKPEIIERVKELQNRILMIREAAVEKGTQEIIDKYAITEAKILGELARMAFSNIMDYIGISEDGQPYVDLSAIDRDMGVAIQEVTCETTVVSQVGADGEREPVTVRKSRFKLADKHKALVELGRNIGMFQQKVEHKVVDTRSAAEQRAELMQELAAYGIPVGALQEEEPQGVANRTH